MIGLAPRPEIAVLPICSIALKCPFMFCSIFIFSTIYSCAHALWFYSIVIALPINDSFKDRYADACTWQFVAHHHLVVFLTDR